MILLLTPIAVNLNPSLPFERRMREFFILAFFNFDLSIKNLTVILLIAEFFLRLLFSKENIYWQSLHLLAFSQRSENKL